VRRGGRGGAGAVLFPPPAPRLVVRGTRVRAVPGHPHAPSSRHARELHLGGRGRLAARTVAPDRRRRREPAHGSRRSAADLRLVGLELSLALHDLAVARRALEGGEPLRRAARWPAAGPSSLGWRAPRRCADEPTEEEGREPAAPAVTVHGTIMACESSASAIFSWT